MSHKSHAGRILIAIAASGLVACAAGGTEEPTTDQSPTDPSLFSGDVAPPADENEKQPVAHEAERNGAAALAITYNHPAPHALAIPAIDLTTRRPGSFELTPGGGAYGETHTHAVTLTARQLSELADGAQVTVETTPGGTGSLHTHVVTLGRL